MALLDRLGVTHPPTPSAVGLVTSDHEHRAPAVVGDVAAHRTEQDVDDRSVAVGTDHDHRGAQLVGPLAEARPDRFRATFDDLLVDRVWPEGLRGAGEATLGRDDHLAVVGLSLFEGLDRSLEPAGILLGVVKLVDDGDESDFGAGRQ